MKLVRGQMFLTSKDYVHPTLLLRQLSRCLANEKA